jgi:hypothetical protein
VAHLEETCRLQLRGQSRHWRLRAAPCSHFHHTRRCASGTVTPSIQHAVLDRVNVDLRPINFAIGATAVNKAASLSVVAKAARSGCGPLTRPWRCDVIPPDRRPDAQAFGQGTRCGAPWGAKTEADPATVGGKLLPSWPLRRGASCRGLGRRRGALEPRARKPAGLVAHSFCGVAEWSGHPWWRRDDCCVSHAGKGFDFDRSLMMLNCVLLWSRRFGFAGRGVRQSELETISRLAS